MAAFSRTYAAQSALFLQLFDVSSMDRSVTPINEASSGMVNFTFCSYAARISPDVFCELVTDRFI